MNRWLLPILVFCLIAFFGCSDVKSPVNPDPVNPDPERNVEAFANDYTFITGITSGTSWGDVYLNANKMGYGNVPVKCGDYVYFIQYLSNFIPPSTPAKTVPVKYNINTGAITQLGPVSSGYDLWNKIDATLDGTLMIGKYGVTTVKKGSKTYNLTYVTNAELSDDGNFVFYVQNNKAYRMNLNTGAKNTLCSTGYVSEVATNADGSKAVIMTSVNSKNNLYIWNGTLSAIGTGYSYYMGIDMSPDGIASYSVNGKCYWWDGAHKLAGSGVFPAVCDGIMLFGNSGKLMSFNLSTSASSTVGSYSTAVQQVSWAKETNDEPSGGPPEGPPVEPADAICLT